MELFPTPSVGDDHLDDYAQNPCSQPGCKLSGGGSSKQRRVRGAKRGFKKMVGEEDDDDGAADTEEAQCESERNVENEAALIAATSGTLLPMGGIGDHAYRPDVDGLRAVAVLAVIVYHVNEAWLPGGFVGVDIFFVISGFVVTGSLLHKPQRSRIDFLLAFYSRRVKRLSPSLLIVVLATSVALAVKLPPWAAPLDEYFLSGMLSLVGMANMHYATLPTGYFDAGQTGLKLNPFTHCWSLAVEEQFYGLFPFLVLLIFGRRVSTLAGPRWTDNRPITINLVLGATLLASLVTSVVITQRAPTYAFYVQQPPAHA